MTERLKMVSRTVSQQPQLVFIVGASHCDSAVQL